MKHNYNIFYTAGCHGNFLKYLFDCYHFKKLLPLEFAQNGNSHMRQDNGNIYKNIDLCSMHQYFLDCADLKKDYAVVWSTLDSFFYAMSSYMDRGAFLTESGIELLQKDVLAYEKAYEYPVYISNCLADNFNYKCQYNKSTPRSVLRNYFLLTFYTHFEHLLWQRNFELNNLKIQKIQLFDILDYNKISNFLNAQFGYNIDFKSVHTTFLQKNIPLKQLTLVSELIKNIEDGVNTPINGLNVISEAYLMFCLDINNFDIPFHLSNNFFATTGDIIDYIKHFPAFMRRPNNMFFKHYKKYKRKK